MWPFDKSFNAILEYHFVSSFFELNYKLILIKAPLSAVVLDDGKINYLLRSETNRKKSSIHQINVLSESNETAAISSLTSLEGIIFSTKRNFSNEIEELNNFRKSNSDVHPRAVYTKKGRLYVSQEVLNNDYYKKELIKIVYDCEDILEDKNSMRAYKSLIK